MFHVRLGLNLRFFTKFFHFSTANLLSSVALQSLLFPASWTLKKVKKDFSMNMKEVENAKKTSLMSKEKFIKSENKTENKVLHAQHVRFTF